MVVWGYRALAERSGAGFVCGVALATGLAWHIEETLIRTVEDFADEIQAAAFVLLAFGKEAWPADAYTR